MNVAEIPANTLVTMTPELYQEFCQGGCVPACHFTNEWINIGEPFHLSTVKHLSHGKYTVYPGTSAVEKYGDKADEVLFESKDVMLSGAVTVEEYDARELNTLMSARAEYEQKRRGGCYRVNGKIVL